MDPRTAPDASKNQPLSTWVAICVTEDVRLTSMSLLGGRSESQGFEYDDDPR